MRVVCSKNISTNAPTPPQIVNNNYSGRVVVYENVKTVELTTVTDSIIYRFTFNDNTQAYVEANEFSIMAFGGVVDE